MATARSNAFAQFMNDQSPVTAVALAISDHQAQQITDRVFLDMLKVAYSQVADHERVLHALEGAFIAMGKAGANADLNHPQRAAWEAARQALRDAGRVS